MKKINPKIAFLLVPGVVIAYPDPTRPPDYVPSNSTASPLMPTTFTLNAVFIYPHYHVAIINNQPFKIGDKIGQYTVTIIEANTVELRGSQDDKETLSLSPSIKALRSQ